VSELGGILIGFLAGGVAGLMGVGGGILFVPALTIFLDQNQLHAEATSLLAIIPVALVGAWRQYRYGNLEVRDGVLTGVLAIPAAVAGVAIVNAVPERAIQIAFAIFMLFVAAQLARRALAE